MSAPYYFQLRDGTKMLDRPRDGRPYTVVVTDMAAYEKAMQSGAFYAGLGGPITDNRKAPG